MPAPGALLVVALAVFSGAMLNALSGFGFALITVPLMTLALGPKEAVVLSAVVGLVSNSVVLLRNRRAVERGLAGRLLAGSVVGMPLGVLVLSHVPEGPLQVAMALSVLGAAALYGSGARVVAPGAALDAAAGLVSGAFNTSVGISGPPVVVTLTGHRLDKSAFRATSVAVFALSGVVAIALFTAAGRLDTGVLGTALVALPALPLGLVVGDRVHLGVPENRFRHIVLGLLVLTSLATLWNALAG
ncbi:MAG: sulfite exporter TauE/SafE family protein [Microthrixaceae bacterium]